MQVANLPQRVPSEISRGSLDVGQARRPVLEQIAHSRERRSDPSLGTPT